MVFFNRLAQIASEYLKKRTKEEEIEAWLSAYERVPLTEDELAFDRWKEQHWAELFADEPGPKLKRRSR